MTRYLVTSALPYANGAPHFGHVCGAYLPADVYVRTLRRQGDDVAFICGTDEYGVAITIGAEENGQEYPEYVAHWREVISDLFTRLGIEFDIFSGTSISPQHPETAQQFFRELDAQGYLEKRANDQLYCTHDDMFLADRYVLGTCPKCGFPDARGDECPSCGSWLDPLDFEDPRCGICGNTPAPRTTTHWFLDIPKLRDDFIGRWIEEHSWKPNVEKFIQNLLKDVPQRAITRDMRWGVPVPEDMAGGEVGKVLYVWFDAPIGYISFTKEWCAARGEDPSAWEAYWKGDDAKIVHFIGKDNIPFHCMVFPSMLYGTKAGYQLPWHVPANEFYNLQGRKFSTSGGWTIDLEDFFSRYDAEAARFYLLSSLPETSDSEFLWEEFQRTVNSSLAGTIGNLATRVLKFIVKNFDGRIPPLHEAHREEMEQVLFEECGAIGDPAEHVHAFRFRKAAEQLVANASVANVFVDRLAPWALRKTDLEKAESALNILCEWIGWVSSWMTPFMPNKAQRLWEMLGQEGEIASKPWPGIPQAGDWRRLETGTPLGEVEGLFPRIDDDAIKGEIEALEARAAAAEATSDA